MPGNMPARLVRSNPNDLSEACDRASSSLRVLFVTPRYLPFMGGVENHVAEVARRMVVAGADVTVLTTDPGGQLEPVQTLDGVKIIRVRAYPAHHDYYFAPALYGVITRRAWDIVHIQSYHTLVAPLAMLAAWRAGLPYVVTFHGGGHSSHVRNAGRAIQRQLLSPLLAHADRLVTIADFERDLFERTLRLPARKFVTIPNGADLPRVDPNSVSAASQRSGDEVVIASIGRLEQYKGHQRLIEALPHVLHHKPNVRLWIAGTGPYEGELERRAAALGVVDRITIAAVPPHERMRMAQELARTDLVVSMSEYETHPIAILEALGLGRPAIVAETSGLKELVERGYARGVPLASAPHVLAQAILAELDAPTVRQPLALPTWDECAQKLLALYGSILDQSPRARGGQLDNTVVGGVQCGS